MGRNLFTVRHLGVPIGNVQLTADATVSAGQLTPTPAYAAIRDVVREGSNALLQVGFFGALAQLSNSGAPVPALRAAAALSLDLVDDAGNDVAATFVNLIEPPDDNQVVVLARLSHSYSRTPAMRSGPVRRASGQNSASDNA